MVRWTAGVDNRPASSPSPTAMRPCLPPPPIPSLPRAAAVMLAACVATGLLAPRPAASQSDIAAGAKAAAKAAVVGKATQKATQKARDLADPTPSPATPEQVDAAERVYYGVYECEFNQAIDISIHPKYAAYVDVRVAGKTYVMKPVLSSTGAIRLEDTRGETLMVQIANKSMLLNVKTGHRVVDDCISPKQRDLIAAAAAAKAAGGATESTGGIFGAQATTAAK